MTSICVQNTTKKRVADYQSSSVSLLTQAKLISRKNTPIALQMSFFSRLHANWWTILQKVGFSKQMRLAF